MGFGLILLILSYLNVKLRKMSNLLWQQEALSILWRLIHQEVCGSLDRNHLVVSTLKMYLKKTMINNFIP
jgi:hypothetical protein